MIPMLQRSYYLVIISILLLPWYVVRWQIAGIPTTLLEIAVLLLILVWVVERMKIGYSSKSLKRAAKEHQWLLLWSSLFLVAATISVFVSPNHFQALGQYKAYIVEPMLVGLIVVDVVRAHPKRWWGIIVALLVAGAEVVLVGLSQAIIGWPNLAPAELVQGRISSFFNSANAVGLFLGPLLFLASCLRRAKVMAHFWLRAAMIFGLVAGACVIVLTQSNGALLGVILPGFTIFAAYELWRRYGPFTWPSLKLLRRFFIISLFLYIIGCLAFVWFFNHPPSVANPYTRPDFSTFTVRQCLWEGTKSLLTDKPITGSGLAGFSQTYLPYSTCDAEPLVYPHMLVLNFWTELGALGLVAVVGLMGWWLWIAADLLRHPGRGGWVGLALLLGLVYWLIHGLVDVPYFKNDLSMEWWIFVGLIVTSRYVFVDGQWDAADDEA